VLWVTSQRLGKLMRRHMVLAVRLQKPAPPGHDHPALFEELGLVDISGPHVVALLVAHLPLDSHLRPQSGLDQSTARHVSELLAADIHLSESGTHREHQIELAVIVWLQHECTRPE